MTDEELKRRLLDHEDNWTERKESHQTDEIRKQLVAFANSVPEGEHAVLFIGVNDAGKVVGVGENPSETQKKISRSATEWCYPPVRHLIRVISVDNKAVLAVVIEASHDRPHFAGPAFVRIGSQSKNASEQLYSELIASRSNKAWPLIEAKRRGRGAVVTHYPLGKENRGLRNPPLQCVIAQVTPQSAVFRASTGGSISASLEQMDVYIDHDGNVRVTIDGGG